MKKINLPKSLITFFEENQRELEKNYPGINKLVLLRFLDDLTLDEYTKDPHSIHSNLMQGIPLEYITGKKFFYDFELYLNQSVLIPRFETEILVHEAIEFSQSNQIKSFIDIGTGSGAIFVNVLKAYDKFDLAVATDIDEDALQVCKINLEKLSPQSHTDLIKSDKWNQVNQSFDMILSNPPYIKYEQDKAGVHFQADKYEPHTALYLADAEYDAWFDDFFKNSLDNLNSKGLFLMEGHEDHLKALASKLEAFNRGEVLILKDLNGCDRFIKLIKE